MRGLVPLFLLGGSMDYNRLARKMARDYAVKLNEAKQEAERRQAIDETVKRRGNKVTPKRRRTR